MSRQCRLHGDLRGLQVADLTNHDHVRILSHDRAQSIREREIDLRFDLNLVDARHLVFDRILYRQDFHVRLVESRERGIERGGFSAAGRPGDQQYAVRLIENRDEDLQVLIIESERMKIERHTAFIQNPHHHRFAMHRGYRRHPQIDFLALHAQFDASVLRQTPLGNIEGGHDFDARNHCGGQSSRR